MLANMLAKAQIIADTFRGKWEDGVHISEVRAALDKLDSLPNLPSYLIGDGITEPLAAGASRLRKDEN